MGEVHVEPPKLGKYRIFVVGNLSKLAKNGLSNSDHLTQFMSRRPRSGFVHFPDRKFHRKLDRRLRTESLFSYGIKIKYKILKFSINK